MSRVRWTNWPAFNRWCREQPAVPAWAREGCHCTESELCDTCLRWAELWLEIQARRQAWTEAQRAR